KFGPLLTDGSRLYFSKTDAGATIAQVSSTGGDTVPVPAPFKSPFPLLLDISPNRSEMLIATPASITTSEGPLWILPLLGGSPRRLTDLLADAGAWSPDGQKIAYARQSALYLAKSDGTESHKLVGVDGLLDDLSWSPDGGRLRLTLRNRRTGSTSLWEV